MLYVSNACHFCNQFINLTGEIANSGAWFTQIDVNRVIAEGTDLDPRVQSVPTIIDPSSGYVYRGADAFLLLQHIKKARTEPGAYGYQAAQGASSSSSAGTLRGGAQDKGGTGVRGVAGECTIESCFLSRDKFGPCSSLLATSTGTDASMRAPTTDDATVMFDRLQPTSV